jgi:hypothetical protein
MLNRIKKVIKTGSKNNWKIFLTGEYVEGAGSTDNWRWFVL